MAYPQNTSNQITEPLNWQQLIFLQIRDIEKLRYTNKAACVEAIKGLESLMNDKLKENDTINKKVLDIKRNMVARLKDLPEKNRKDEQYMIAWRANYYNDVYLQIVKLVGRHYSPLSRVQQVIEDDYLKKKYTPQLTRS